MDEMIKSIENYLFTTTTADVLLPDEFVVELVSDLSENDNKEKAVVTIHNFDELIDFLEKNDW